MITKTTSIKSFDIESNYSNVTRATMKISYSTTRNMKAHIASHNFKVLNKKDDGEPDTCNCRENGPPCPLGGECQVESIAYKATVTTKENTPVSRAVPGKAGKATALP